MARGCRQGWRIFPLPFSFSVLNVVHLLCLSSGQCSTCPVNSHVLIIKHTECLMYCEDLVESGKRPDCRTKMLPMQIRAYWYLCHWRGRDIMTYPTVMVIQSGAKTRIESNHG